MTTPISKEQAIERCKQEVELTLNGRCQRENGHIGLCSLNYGPLDDAGLPVLPEPDAHITIRHGAECPVCSNFTLTTDAPLTFRDLNIS